MDALFNLPDFIAGRGVYTTLVDYSQQAKDFLLPNTGIACVYGNFPSCIWNGGGINVNGSWTKPQIQELIEFYNYGLHIPLRFTFTNPLIDERHLNDTYSNMIAECGHNGMNEILTSSPVLEKYLREKYPKYKFCRSIIGARDQAVDFSDKYYLSVCQRRMNNNWEFLESIPEEKRHKIEFLCTDPCPDNCPRLYTHYRDFARAQLEYLPGTPECACSMNEVKGIFSHKYMHGLETYISREMIDKDYLPRGFNQFKISGRASAMGGIMGALNYMVNPEYRDDALSAFVAASYHDNSI